jgi:glucose 1-dehydrogenase
MRALTVQPGVAGSARIEDVPEPRTGDGSVLVDTLAVGVCGTDAEIVAGEYGEAPAGEDRLILGHESLGRVREAHNGSGLAEGDLVVGIVRHPDPVPCQSCAVGEWDMCRNGLYTEHGIKGLHGFAAEQFRSEPQFLVRLDPALERLGVLLEPTTVVAKAWDHIDRIGSRAYFAPEHALVTGAGTIGLLAALLACERGLDVHVLDRAEDGPKPELVRALGATYHTTDVATIEKEAPPDIVVEATGAPQLVFDVMQHNAKAAVVCLTGVSPTGRDLKLDAGQLGRDIVLENDVIFGSVNANLAHYELAAKALASADRSWLERMITRRVPLERFEEALDSRPDDVKVVLDLQA